MTPVEFERDLIAEVRALARTLNLDRPLVVVICGGREFVNFGMLCLTMDIVAENIRIGMVVHGGARGADKLGGLWAVRRGIAERSIKAQWTAQGNAAGPIRNQAVLDSLPRPDAVVALPGGNGTGDMIVRSRQQGFPVIDIQEIMDALLERARY